MLNAVATPINSGSTTTSSCPDHDPIWLAAVECGGTSFKIAICQMLVPRRHSNNNSSSKNTTNATATTAPRPVIIHRTVIDSSHDRPSETLQECVTFLEQHKPAGNGYHALGVATFGPVGVRADDTATYGRILESTPKAAWRNVDLLTPLRWACQGRLPLAVRLDTDVNAPAWAEYLAATAELRNADASKPTKPITSLAYVTVGTGVGVGLVVNGQTVHGRMHPEGGHVPVQPLPGDTFSGYSWGDGCPFHGKNTVEGLACSVSLTERLQQLQQQEQQQPSTTTQSPLSRSVLSDLPDDHEVWDHAANALANLCVTLLLTVAVEKIVLGGGVMRRPGLLEKIQAQTLILMNGYVVLPDLSNMSTLITKSQEGDDAGLMGAAVLAQTAYWESLQQEKGSKDHDGNDSNDDDQQAKQVAFGYGLVHGMAIGGVIAGFICKYWAKPRARPGRYY